MSENKHTPEPWPVFSDIATTLTPDPEGAPAAILSWDDYIRARACVNACPGIETQDLEALRGTSILAKANASFDTVQKQRDELLADRDTWKARAEFSYQQRDVLEGRASLAEAQRERLTDAPGLGAGFKEIEMAENMSLADQAVQALAMVKAMDENLNMEHPERHAIRNMQRIAKQVIEAGLRSATDLAWQAQDLREMARQIEAADKPHNA